MYVGLLLLCVYIIEGISQDSTVCVPGEQLSSHGFGHSKLHTSTLSATPAVNLTHSLINELSIVPAFRLLTQPIQTNRLLHYQKWKPYKARRLFQAHSCKTEENWPIQYQPRPFYK